MKIVHQGIGENRHALVYTDDGAWVATIRAAYKHEVIEALVEDCGPGANRGAEIKEVNDEA